MRLIKTELTKATCRFVLLILAMFLVTGCRQDTNLPEDPQQWSYARNYPKTAWEKKYPLCRTGGFQSPININSKDVTVVHLPALKIKFFSHAAWLVNNSYSAEVVFKDKGNVLYVNKQAYILQEFHFHTPSENRIRGKRYPMELHFVYHKDNRWVVVAVLFQKGNENPALTQLLQRLPHSLGKVDLNAMPLDFKQLLPANLSSYYSFEGSLTTPPCSRHITWYLLKEPVMASASQVAYLKKMFGDNARPIQPLNRRKVISNI